MTITMCRSIRAKQAITSFKVLPAFRLTIIVILSTKKGTVENENHLANFQNSNINRRILYMPLTTKYSRLVGLLLGVSSKINVKYLILNGDCSPQHFSQYQRKICTTIAVIFFPFRCEANSPASNQCPPYLCGASLSSVL